MFNSNKSQVTKVVILILMMTLITTNLNAQIGLPGDGDVDDVPPAFIDGFIGIALAVGAYFGIKNIVKSSKTN